MKEDFRILVVDDEEPIRILWDRFLSRWGYPFDLAENGRVALDMARADPYQLIITDLTMPELSGTDLIYALREEQPEVEFMVITGHATIEIAVDLMKAGAFDFLTKPISFQHAEVVIQNCMERVQARQENERLRAINRDLEALNEIKEKFITITNHELRTPVSVINSIVEILSKELTEGELAGLVRMIQRSALQLNEIVGQMHEISSIKSDKQQLQTNRFSLADLVQEVLGEQSLALEKRGHTLRCDVPDELAVTADRVKFKKVVRELVQNAIKFTDDGGELALTADQDDAGRLVFSVTDTGVGIAPDNIDKIFQLFYEVGDSMHHHTSKDDFMGGGMGVGLSIVQDIVQAHGGTVQVESEMGRGSCFTVLLPQAASSAGAAAS